MSITIDQLKTGQVAQIRFRQFLTLAGISAPTGYRKLKSGELIARRDPASGRIFVRAEDALKFLQSLPHYTHDFQDRKSLELMEYARTHKGVTTTATK